MSLVRGLKVRNANNRNKATVNRCSHLHFVIVFSNIGSDNIATWSRSGSDFWVGTHCMSVPPTDTWNIRRKASNYLFRVVVKREMHTWLSNVFVESTRKNLNYDDIVRSAFLSITRKIGVEVHSVSELAIAILVGIAQLLVQARLRRKNEPPDRLIWIPVLCMASEKMMKWGDRIYAAKSRAYRERKTHLGQNETAACWNLL